MTDKLPDYFEKDPDAKGVYTIVGELWGRHISVVGGANDLLLVEECASAFSCGAHGDASCQFIQFPVGENAKTLDLAAARVALKADTQGLVKKWVAESDGEVEGDPSLDAVFVGFDKGALTVDYLLVAGVSYVATDGEWGSYTQSRKHTGPVVAALGMPELPAEVGAWLATQGASSAVGWSVVPADADAAIAAAFKDVSTVPAEAPKVVEGAAQGGADAGALVKKARKLTRDRELDDAISTFTSAIEADGKHARAWSGRGYARLLAGDLQGADADFKHALTLDDGAKFQGAVYYNLGELAEKQKKLTEAVEAYRKSNSLAPTDAAQKRIDALTAE